MATLHTVQHCRWSEQTLYQPAPRWLESWDYPWCCRTRTGTRVIRDTDTFQTCKRWEPRDRAKLETGDWGQV